MSDSFKDVMFRVDPGTRSAVLDASDVIHYGDSLVFRFSGVPGIDADTATVGIFPKTAGNYQPAVFVAAGSVHFTPGSTDSVYCLASLLTTTVKAAVDAQLPGVPATFRIYLRDSETTFLDQDIDIYPSPLVNAYPPDPAEIYITAGPLKALAAAVAAMPTLTSAQREARLDAWLTGIGGL